MKSSIAAVSLCLVLVASGQQLQRVVHLPDSFSRVESPSALAYSPASNRLFVAGSDAGITIIDCATRQPCGAIDSAACGWGYLRDVRGLYYNPAMDRLYADDGDIQVYDCRTGRYLGGIDYGQNGMLGNLCFNPAANRMYAVIPDSLLVIDCATNHVTARLALDDRAEGGIACYNPVANKVYAFLSDTVTIIDAATNQVLERCPVMVNPYWPTVSTRSNKVYVAHQWRSYVSVIDGQTNRKIEEVDVGGDSGRWAGPVCYDSVQDRVYVACRTEEGDRWVTVIDCPSDRVIASIDLQCHAHDDFPPRIAYSPRTQRLYHYAERGDNMVRVLDCRSLELAGSIELGLEDVHSGMCHLTGPDMIAVAGNPRGSGIASVVLLDCSTNRVLGRVGVGMDVGFLFYSSGSDRLLAGGSSYCPQARDDAGVVFAVDPATGRVLDSATVLCGPNLACLDSRFDRLCVAGYRSAEPMSGVVSVVDVRSMNAVPVQSRSGMPVSMCLNPLRSWAYVSWSGTVSVIDLLRNAVIHNISSPGCGFGALCYNHTADELYAADGGFHRLYVVNQGARITDTVQLPIYPRMLFHDSLGNDLYIAGNLAGQLAVMDCGTRHVRMLDFVPGRARAFALNARQQRVYCADDIGNLCVWEAGAETVMARVRLYASASDLCYEPTSELLFVNNDPVPPEGEWHMVSVVDTRTNRLLRGRDIDVFGPMYFAFVPRLHQVWVTTRSSGIACIDPSDAVEEGENPSVRFLASTTVVREMLRLPAHGPAVLVDITGRPVADLRPGENDIGHIAPGVYFIRQASSVTRVIVAD